MQNTENVYKNTKKIRKPQAVIEIILSLFYFIEFYLSGDKNFEKPRFLSVRAIDRVSFPFVCKCAFFFGRHAPVTHEYDVSALDHF